MAQPAANDFRRQRLLSKIHVAKGQLKLDDETYRAIIRRHGEFAADDTPSAARLKIGQMIDVVEEMKAKGWKDKPARRAGARAQASHPQAAKMRALWLSLYHLGAVRDPKESALASFAQRMTKVSALQWLDVAQANRVIEGLKDMCRREGYDPAPSATLSNKQLLVLAIWAKLAAIGAVRVAHWTGLDEWLTRHIGPGRALHYTQLDETHLDQAAEKLGAWLRKAMKEKESADV